MLVVYKIQSKKLPNAFYIGSTKNYKGRVSKHMFELKNGKHRNRNIQAHCDIYGVEDLYFVIIEEISVIDLLIKREQFYFDLLKPTFNISPTAGTCKGVKATQETKDLISKSKKGVPHRPECFTGKSERQKGKQNALGFKHTEDAKTRIRINNPRRKKVYQYDMDGNFIKQWDCPKDAHRVTGINDNSIYRSLKGFLPHAGFFKWYYNKIDKI